MLSLPDFLNHPTGIGLGLTLAFFVIGALGKGLAREGWKREDAFLGMEAALSAVSGATIYLIELSRKLTELKGSPDGDTEIAEIAQLQINSTLFTIIALVAYFGVASFHKIFEKDNGWKQVVALGIIGNLLGLGILFAFIVLIKHGA
ncbi:MAG TPA: hypothetical protein VG826_25805 [Pirellulales bacterium]|nr:hypothetical protein [Pirellulales bacterium]